MWITGIARAPSNRYQSIKTELGLHGRVNKAKMIQMCQLTLYTALLIQIEFYTGQKASMCDLGQRQGLNLVISPMYFKGVKMLEQAATAMSIFEHIFVQKPTGKLFTKSLQIKYGYNSLYMYMHYFIIMHNTSRKLRFTDR